MRVLLIAANTEQTGMITLPLGLELVNVAVRLAGHESRVLDLNFAKGAAAAVRDALHAFNPDAIGISVRNIDTVPLPDPDSWLRSGAAPDDVWIPVQTRRGCPFHCSYCSTPAIEGRQIRSRSPRRVRDWIARMRDRGFGHFYFVDNTFNLPTA